VSQHFFVCLLVIFLIDLSSSIIEQFAKRTANVRGRHEKIIENKRFRRHCLVPYLLGNVLAKFDGKSSILHSLLRDFLAKWVRVFAF